MENAAIVFVSVLAGLLIALKFSQNPITVPIAIVKSPNPSNSENDRRKAFKFTNYLKIPIIITNESVEIISLQPKSVGFVDESKVVRYLRGGDKISISGAGKLLGEYVIATDYNLSIRELHIGMIVSKWSGADSDYNIGKRGGSAVQGIPYVKIHNETDIPLQLNENINLQPNAIGNYSGRDGFGVRLGTVFRDVNGIFDDFVVDKPITDLYYGVVSDLRLPLFGGFQMIGLGDETTRPLVQDSYEPHHLLEVGWMGGGKDHSKIQYGFLPKEGRIHEDLDRWGQPKNPNNANDFYRLETEQDPQNYKN